MEVRVAERFWSLVRQGSPDECWPWIGPSVARDGRGIFWDGKRNTSASRFALSLALGRPIPAEIFACHSCDNPPCCNPGHLWEGTAKENYDDAISKNRISQQRKIACKAGHPANDANTYITTLGYRVCRPCRNEYMNVYKKRARQKAKSVAFVSQK